MKITLGILLQISKGHLTDSVITTRTTQIDQDRRNDWMSGSALGRTMRTMKITKTMKSKPEGRLGLIEGVMSRRWPDQP